MSVYDVALAYEEELFSSCLRQLCGEYSLSFFLVELLWVREFLDKLIRGEIKVGVLIDMASDPYDPADIYYRLAREVKAAGGHVVDDPDLTPTATHKGKLHKILVDNGVPVPETIIIGREALPTFRLTDEAKSRIGVPFVVKPGWGSGGQGVILNAISETDILKSAQQAPHSDRFMLQRRLVPKVLDNRPGWFRVFHVFGEIIPCWWHPATGAYEMVSPLQRHQFRLQPIEGIVHRIAQLSRMEYFSTEIALTEEGRFVAVDYLNDECDMHAKSYWPSGVPDEIVRRVALLMVQKAVAVVHKRPFRDELVERDKDWQEQKRRRRAAIH
jgi:hypothetical protein